MSYHIRVRAGGIIIKDNAILLVEFNDEKGLHYNFPAGGTEPDESVIEAVQREVKEEAGVDVKVGPLAFVYEYTPHLNDHYFGPVHSLSMLFECEIIGDQQPRMPDKPDPNQTDVKWIPLTQLNNIVLYPNMKKQILEYVWNRNNIELLEEQTLSRL